MKRILILVTISGELTEQSGTNGTFVTQLHDNQTEFKMDTETTHILNQGEY